MKANSIPPLSKDNIAQAIISPIEPYGPRQSEVYDYFTLYHESVGKGDMVTVGQIDARMPILLDAFERDRTEWGSNGRWRHRTVRAGWAFCQQDYERARWYDEDGWGAASAEPESLNRSKRMSVSANNIGASACRQGVVEDKANLIEVGIEWGQKAVQLWRHHPIWNFNLALSLGFGGHSRECGQIVAILAETVGLTTRDDLLSACADHEPDLHKLRHIPEVSALLTKMDDIRRRRAAEQKERGRDS